MGLVLRSVLISVAAGFIMLRVWSLEYQFDDLLPETGYEVKIKINIDSTASPVALKMYLPQSDDRQLISHSTYSGSLPFEIDENSQGLQGLWNTPHVPLPLELEYSYYAKINYARFDLSEDLLIPARHPQAMYAYLKSDASPPLYDFDVQTLYEQITAGEERLSPLLASIFEYVHQLDNQTTENVGAFSSIDHATPKSPLDRHYLFMALAEQAHIPGRLVGGLQLSENAGSSQQHWTELYINNLWVPFDVKQGHFALLPDNYLKLYQGNGAIIESSSGVFVEHQIHVQKELISRPFIGNARQSIPAYLNPYAVWQSFLATGMPLVSLKILLLIPLAATIVAFFRNVIGLETYGVFLPALIASSGLHSGILPALFGFLLVTLLVAAIHAPLEKIGLLYVPKLALMLLAVVAVLIGLSYTSFELGLSDIFSLSLLPLVIMAISAERLSQHLQEEGILKAAQVMGMTLIVIGVCFFVINQSSIQWLLFTFPELLIVVAVINLWMGQWIGLRLIEFSRFRWLIYRDKHPEALVTPKQEVLGINRRNGTVIQEANQRRDLVLANDKHISKQLLERNHIPVPATIAHFSEIRDLKENWNQLLRLKEFVVKPAQGKRGNNILVLSKHAKGWTTPGGRLFDKIALQKHIADIIFGSHTSGTRDTALIEYRVHTHPFFTTIYTQGLPDLRVITHHGRIVQAMLRIPTDASDGKANLHQGALGVGVDLKSGTLKRGFHDGRYITSHPDSSRILTGLRIPHWPQILAISRQTAQLVPLKYLGIDIVIDRIRGPLVLEINARPGLQIQNINEQGLRPLLETHEQAI